MESKQLTVYNIQNYAVGRGGHVFPSQEEKTVIVHRESDYRQIKACVYLQLRGDEPLAPSAPPDGETGEGDDLGAHLMAQTNKEIRAYAAERGIDLPSKGAKEVLVGEILKASAPSATTATEDEDGDGDGDDGESSETEDSPSATAEGEDAATSSLTTQEGEAGEGDESPSVIIATDEDDEALTGSEDADATPATDEA